MEKKHQHVCLADVIAQTKSVMRGVRGLRPRCIMRLVSLSFVYAIGWMNMVG
jgi:hypothetical protein